MTVEVTTDVTGIGSVEVMTGVIGTGSVEIRWPGGPFPSPGLSGGIVGSWNGAGGRPRPCGALAIKVLQSAKEPPSACTESESPITSMSGTCWVNLITKIAQESKTKRSTHA